MPNPPPLRVVNPATGALVAEVAPDGPAEVAAAVERARRAQPAWAATPFGERARALRRLAHRLVVDPELVPILMSESGKPRFEAEGIEVFYAAEMTRFATGRTARRALRDGIRRPFAFPYKRSRVVHHPRGVVGVIGPWNWPLLNNYADCVAALAAGNAVLLKPSPVTPLTSLHVEKLWREEGLPADVFQVILGGPEAGEALVGAVDFVFFTGSQASGRKVAQAAGARLVPYALELGGNSPMIVLRDADLRRAAKAAVWSGFAHSGQVCIRTERVIVEAPAHDELVRLVLEEVKKLRQGPASPDADTDVDVGAITFPPQIERAERQIAHALENGARLAAGGARRPDLGPGFFAPTLLVEVTPDMDVAKEETFGPVVPIVRVADEEEALRVANEGPHGLAGSIWSRDEARARALARRMEAGSVCVNDVLVNYFCVESPLGGMKASGLGVRHGPEGIRQFCRIETIVEDRPFAGRLSGFLSSQLGFPYQARVLCLLRWVMRRVY